MFQAGFYLNLLSENQRQGLKKAISFEEVWCLRKGVLLGNLNKSDSTLLKQCEAFQKIKLPIGWSLLSASGILLYVV